MIKQKRVKVKQAILPFILEKTYEIITPRAGLVLFGEFLHGLRLNQRTDKYLPLPPPYEKKKEKKTVHCMEKTKRAFRLIVVRRPYQPRL
ncbi:MAG: hypothetical protein LWW94_09370, partial [Candidatus Desulfofervidaceae bacterium]|nr:hypothetical protein [Candidatus Desulfofervidaceae bacterium]